jgi:uncharacterized protein YnzC (UPF0291/DUF896 family)
MGCHGSCIGLSLVLVGFVFGAQDSPYEKSLQEAIDSFEKIGASLKTIKDEASAAAAKPQLSKSADEFLAARAHAAKLPPPEKDEKQRLEATYKPKLEAAMKKMFTEIRRVELVDGGKDALKELDRILKNKDGSSKQP